MSGPGEDRLAGEPAPCTDLSTILRTPIYNQP